MNEPVVAMKNWGRKTNGILAMPLVIFLFSLLIPTSKSIYIFGLRLSIYRLILILAILPIIIARNRLKPDTDAADYFAILGAMLMFAALVVNNGETGVKFGGSLVLETLVPYFLGRTFVRDEEQVKKFGNAFLLFLLCILPAIIYEAASGVNLFGAYDTNQMDKRLGLFRCYGPFDHPILMGVFVASGISILNVSSFRGKALFESVPIVLTAASVSSGAYVMAAVQFAFRFVRKFSSITLQAYIVVAIAGYALISIFSNRSPLAVLSSYLSLDERTAYFRILIFEAAMKNIYSNPVFGLGLNDWERPDWMGSSLDSFYFIVAVQYGLPALACVLIVQYRALASTFTRNTRLSVSYRGLLMSMSLAVFTVHIWNSVYTFFWLILGICINIKKINVQPITEAGARID